MYTPPVGDLHYGTNRAKRKTPPLNVPGKRFLDLPGAMDLSNIDSHLKKVQYCDRICQTGVIWSWKGLQAERRVSKSSVTVKEVLRYGFTGHLTKEGYIGILTLKRREMESRGQGVNMVTYGLQWRSDYHWRLKYADLPGIGRGHPRAELSFQPC